MGISLVKYFCEIGFTEGTLWKSPFRSTRNNSSCGKADVNRGLFAGSAKAFFPEFFGTLRSRRVSQRILSTGVAFWGVLNYQRRVER